MGRTDAVGDREREFDDETVERLACAARMHAAPTVEAEQRVVTGASTALDLADEERADARPVRNEAALAELTAPYDEELALRVDVAEPEPARFPSSQAESVAEGEDGVVGRRATSCPWVVRKSGRGDEQLTSLRDVEEEGQTQIGLSSPGPVQR